jgi:hypothetical protein
MKSSRFLLLLLGVEISTAASPDDEEWHQLVYEYLQGSAEFGVTSPENGGGSYVRAGENSSKRGRVDPLGMPEANVMSASPSESESRWIKELRSGPVNALPPSESHQPSQATGTDGRETKRACHGMPTVTEKQRQDDPARVSRLHLDTNLAAVHDQLHEGGQCQEASLISKQGQLDHAELPKSFAMGTESQQETHFRSGQPITAKKNGIDDQPGPSQLHLHDESSKQYQSHPSSKTFDELMETTAPPHNFALSSSEIALDSSGQREINQHQISYNLAINNVYQELHGSETATVSVKRIGNWPVDIIVAPLLNSNDQDPTSLVIPLNSQGKVYDPHILNTAFRDLITRLNQKHSLIWRHLNRNLPAHPYLRFDFCKLIDWLFGEVFNPQNEIPVLGKTKIKIYDSVQFGKVQLWIIKPLQGLESLHSVSLVILGIWFKDRSDWWEEIFTIGDSFWVQPQVPFSINERKNGNLEYTFSTGLKVQAIGVFSSDPVNSCAFRNSEIHDHAQNHYRTQSNKLKQRQAIHSDIAPKIPFTKSGSNRIQEFFQDPMSSILELGMNKKQNTVSENQNVQGEKKDDTIVDTNQKGKNKQTKTSQIHPNEGSRKKSKSDHNSNFIDEKIHGSRGKPSFTKKLPLRTPQFTLENSIQGGANPYKKPFEVAISNVYQSLQGLPTSTVYRIGNWPAEIIVTPLSNSNGEDPISFILPLDPAGNVYYTYMLNKTFENLNTCLNTKYMDVWRRINKNFPSHSNLVLNRQKLSNWLFGEVFNPKNGIPVLGKTKIKVFDGIQFGQVQLCIIKLLHGSESLNKISLEISELWFKYAHDFTN